MHYTAYHHYPLQPNMFAEVMVNQKYSNVKGSFTYKIPKGMKVKKGSLVIVPYTNRQLGGVVLKTTTEEPDFKTREIIEINPLHPCLQPWQLETAEFISNYYLANLYKALKLFIPNKIWNLKGKNELPEEKEEAIKTPNLTLEKAQKDALKKLLGTNRKFLIHGITSSGKTEIYLHLAHKLASEDKQTLILVPEISLTPQLTNYFQKVFGTKTAILHSQLTEKQRTMEWLRIANGRAKIIIGPRSALFSPFKNLGAIILDEEHDTSYKQDQSPRYDAGTVAEKICDLQTCKLIYGSATPSIENYHRAQKGELELIHLPDRIGKTPLPNVKIIDMREEMKARNFGIFSNELLQKLSETLAKGHQAILFLNRRGTASSLTCRECGFSPECKNCSVRMTYHRGGTLICHHCSNKKEAPLRCPNCESVYIKTIGIGTERIEQEICTRFPKARVLRADRDTVKTRHDFPRIYKAFKQHKADILIGTQMIGKGLDIEKVDLVAVILADIGLHIPDFRAQEHTFQTLTQVAGRAGRRKDQGSVIIQTYVPDNFAIKAASEHNYKKMYENEIKSRKKLELPPFNKMIKLTYVDTSFDRAKRKTNEAKQVLGGVSAPALITKKHGKYHYNLFLKGKSFKKTLPKIKELTGQDENWRIDIDPIVTV